MDDLERTLTTTLPPRVEPPPVDTIRARGRRLRRRRHARVAVASMATVTVAVAAALALTPGTILGPVVDPVAPGEPLPAPAEETPSTAASQAPPAVVLPEGELIIHQRSYDIHAVSLSGEEVPVYEAPTIEVSPDVSPDGQHILFSSGDGDNFDLFVMTIDGTDVTQLTDTPEDPEFEARWSPDGSQIVYMRRNVAAERSEIWTMRPDGSAQTPIRTEAEASLVPVWSPDGRSIAFTSYTGESFDVWTMDADGSDARRLTDLPRDEWNTTWSPDGSYIAFSAAPDGGDRDLYVVHVESGEVTLLLDTSRDATGPWWHPDGKRLAFELDRQIWVVEVIETSTGLVASEPVSVTSGPNQRGAPTWRVGD